MDGRVVECLGCGRRHHVRSSSRVRRATCPCGRVLSARRGLGERLGDAVALGFGFGLLATCAAVGGCIRRADRGLVTPWFVVAWAAAGLTVGLVTGFFCRDVGLAWFDRLTERRR